MAAAAVAQRNTGGLAGATGGVSGSLSKRRTGHAQPAHQKQSAPTTSSAYSPKKPAPKRMWTRVGDMIVIVNGENRDSPSTGVTQQPQQAHSRSRSPQSPTARAAATAGGMDSGQQQQPEYPHFTSQRDYMTLSLSARTGHMVSRTDAPGALDLKLTRKRSKPVVIAAATIRSVLWKQKGSQWIKRSFCVDSGNLCQLGGDSSGRRHLIALSSDVVVKRKTDRVFKIQRDSVDFCRCFRAKTLQEAANWLAVLRQHGCTVQK